MRILTLFPPLVASCFRGPHLAPPLLAVLLNRERDFSASYLDLNIRAVHSLLFDLFPAVSESILEHCDDSHSRSLLRKIDLLNAEGQIYSQLELIRTYLSLASEYFLKRTNSLARNLEVLSPERANSAGVMFYRELLGEAIASEQADVFMISVAFAEQMEAALVFARMFKEQGARSVFLGGSQITLLEPEQIEQVRSLELIDKICVGYYEGKLAELITSHVPGSGSTVHRPKTIRKESIQSLPRVTFNRDEIPMYFEPLELPVLATKGCYWGKCTFCDYAKMAAYCSPGYLVRDAETIFGEIVALRMRYPEANIVLISDGISPSLYLQLCRIAIKNRVKINTWSYMLHSEQLTDEFFKALSEAGVGFIDSGSESTCNRILELMRKPTQRDSIIENFVLAKKHGIAATMNVIIDFPSIQYDECQGVIKDMRSLMPYVSSFNPQFFHLSSNTPIHDMIESLDIDPGAEYCDTGHGLQCKEFTVASGMTDDERNEIATTIGKICLEHRISQRISGLGITPRGGEVYSCYRDVGAFTFFRGEQCFVNVPSLLLEVSVTSFFAELIQCILVLKNPLKCSVLDTDEEEYYLEGGAA